MSGANGGGANDTGATKAPVHFRIGCRSERWMGDVDVELGYPVVVQSLLKNRLIVRPDPVAQIVEQLDNYERLIR